ncbi:MAG TPA: biopolymer transporter ExbD [Pyrinomonadaceae bacterium]|jgi:biopolymer transport protein ExbD
MRDEESETSTHARPADAPAPSINVTPLIDILLVLLIIFMVITPLRPARFRAHVPTQPPDDPRILKSQLTLVVEVDAAQRLKLIRGDETVAEGTVGDAGAVAARLAAEWRERKLAGNWRVGMEARPDLPPDDRIERTVFVRAPRSTRYGEVAKVIDAVKGAGAQPVGLQTEALPN